MRNTLKWCICKLFSGLEVLCWHEQDAKFTRRLPMQIANRMVYERLMKESGLVS